MIHELLTMANWRSSCVGTSCYPSLAPRFQGLRQVITEYISVEVRLKFPEHRPGPS